MEDQVTTRQLLETYYKGFAVKQGWEQTIADDFIFSLGGRRGPVIKGKEMYIGLIKGFYRSYEAVKVKAMMIEPDKACAVATYTINSIKETQTDFDIAEVWTIKNNKLSSLTIFYDTVNYNGFIVNGR